VHGVRMIQEPKQRVAKQVPSVLKSCGGGLPPEAEPSPEKEKISAQEVQADLEEINTMISEGGPTCSTGSVSIPGTLDEEEQVTGLIQELQTNQAALKKLANWYGTFVFTGGDVPSGQCDLVAINSYLERPSAADRIPTRAVERYQRLVGEIMELGLGFAPGPRTLRCRKGIGDAFRRVSSQIQSLGSALKSALTSRAQSSLENQSVLGITNA
jgi:hypothetical protein